MPSGSPIGIEETCALDRREEVEGLRRDLEPRDPRFRLNPAEFEGRREKSTQHHEMVVDGLRRKAAAHLLGLEPLNVHRGDRAEEPPVEAGKDVLDERGPVLGLD